MPKVIVKYKNKRTLEALRDFAKYFDFEVCLPENLQKTENVNPENITIIPGDSSIDTKELTKIFTGKNIKASELRMEAWQRRK